MRKIISSFRLYIIFLVLLALWSFVLQPMQVWGQINLTQSSSFGNYAQPNLQFNYPFSSISQNTYPSGLSGLDIFTSNSILFNSPYSTNPYNPSLSSIMGMGRGFYNPIGNYPNLNYPSSNLLFPRIPNIINIISPPSHPITFPAPQIFPPVLFPTTINVPTIAFPSPYPSPFPFPSPYPFPFPSPPQPAPQPQPEPQKLFQSEYTNYAMGYTHLGWYIMDNGKVYSFKNKRYSPEDGDEIEFVHTIDPIILEEKRSLISAASQGPYSERKITAFDAGSHVYSAFLGDTEILLKESWDWSQENLSPAAKALVAWLDNIEIELMAIRPKLFKVEYTNLAWGYEHSGFYITEAGNLLTFQNKGISQEEGDDIEFVRTIGSDILEEKRNLIEPASLGPYSGRIHTAFDAGSLIYSAFLGNNEILLRETGDFTQENLSSSAIAILTWLQEIEAELNQ